MSERHLLPPIDGTNEAFWEGTRKGELRVQACASCQRYLHPPRPMCPSCHATETRWVTLSGRGTIWSFVVPHPPLLPQFMDVAPYNVIAVTLDEDPTLRMLGNLVEEAGAPINAIDPATIEIGSPVRVVFERLTDEVHIPRWVRA